jgi:hypothetical protein
MTTGSVGTALPGPTASEAEAFTRVNGRLTIADYVPVDVHDGTPAASKCEWTAHVAADLSQNEVAALAWLLIDTIMQARCGVAVSVYQTWRQHTLAGTTITPQTKRDVVAGFVEPVFGLPENGPKSTDHLEGHVGEWLWHLLTKDRPAVRLQPDPKGDVTDSGGDSYSVYETAADELRFRLWESKKNTATTKTVSTSLIEAYNQLARDGQRYVAKIVGTFSAPTNDAADELRTFIANLPEAWAQGDEIVGAGVTLATHQQLPAKPFAKMPDKLPLLRRPGQLRGLATSIASFAEVADTVRRYAWTAL